MLLYKAWKLVTCSCRNSIMQKLCPYLAHDFKGFIVDENASETREKTV
jgi:hypothetical protein